MQKDATCVYNRVVEEYTQVPGKCPYCDAHLVFRNNLIVLTSYPPKHQYTCKGCGKGWSAFNDSEAVKKEGSPMHSFEPSLNSECISEETTAGKFFSYSIGDVPGDSFKYWGQQGWICPKCGAVLSPWVSECPHCKPGVSKITTTPGTTYKFPDDYVNVDHTKTICKDDFTCSISSAENVTNVTVSG